LESIFVFNFSDCPNLDISKLKDALFNKIVLLPDSITDDFDPGSNVVTYADSLKDVYDSNGVRLGSKDEIITINLPLISGGEVFNVLLIDIVYRSGKWRQKGSGEDRIVAGDDLAGSGLSIGGFPITKANLSGVKGLINSQTSDSEISELNSTWLPNGCKIMNRRIFGPNVDLRNADLKDAGFDFSSGGKGDEPLDLANANLSNCDLSGKKFTNCNLSGANLSGCNMTNVKLVCKSSEKPAHLPFDGDSRYFFVPKNGVQVDTNSDTYSLVPVDDELMLWGPNLDVSGLKLNLNNFFKGRDLRGMNLTGLDFRGHDLRGTKF
jgi:uncharacterized protein YjbI with pentapeptide repeats